MWEMHRRIGGDIPGTFADLQRAGHVEIITCAATHGYLPLLARDESIHLQLRTAVETHRRHFGRAPRGIWLPECAYRPRYEWTPPTGPDSGRERRVRPGIEEMLATYGLEYFVADAHLVSAESAAVPLSRLPSARARTSRASRRRRCPRVRHSRPTFPIGSPRGVAMARPSPSSATRGPRFRCGAASTAIPGDYAFLEFHKKHFPGGLRFWRITDHRGDLGTKAVYDPDSRRPEGRPPGGPLRRPRTGHARAGRQGTVGRLLALRRGAVRALVVRGPAVARARRPRDGAPQGPAHDARRSRSSRAGADDPGAPGRLVGRGRRPSGVAQPRHRVDVGPRSTAPRRSGSGISRGSPVTVAPSSTACSRRRRASCCCSSPPTGSS